MTEKEQQIYTMKRSGLSYQEIGKYFNVSRQRIHQLYNRMVDHYGIQKYIKPRKQSKIREVKEKKPKLLPFSTDKCNICGVKFYGITGEEPQYKNGRPFCNDHFYIAP